MERIELTFENPDEPSIRLDAWLSGKMPLHSRAFLKELIDQGHVRVDGKSVKPSYKAKSGQTIAVELPDPVDSTVRPEAIPLDIRYEDEWLLVIDKPQGMVVHPAPGHSGGTLVNALLSYCQGQLSDLNGVIRPGIVHRIDKDTTGLLLVVKDNSVHREIAEKIRHHEVRRTYQALVHGTVTVDQGTIKAPVGRDPRNRQRMAVVADGKNAITHFKVVERLAKASWLEVELETGRTHQIRVHCQYIGHPIVGDPVYALGRDTFGQSGQVLHASRLSFIHPVTHQPVVVESPVPLSFLEAVQRCR